MKYEHLPEGWRLIKLGDVLEQQYRQEKLQEGTNYTTLGVRWYAGGTFIKQERDGDDISASYLNRVEEGDFIYNRLFAWKGSFAVVPAAHAGYYVSNEFPVFKIKVPDQVDLDYLLWYTKRAHFWEYIATLSTGTSNASRLRYKEEDLLRESIPLPPIDEQRRIAEVLRDADANLSRVEAQIEAAQEVKRGTMQRLFTYGLSGEGAPTRRSDFGHIPYHWHIAPLEQCAYVQTGATKGRDFNGSRVISVPYLRVANVQDGYLDLSEIKYIDIREEEFDRYSLQPGDVLLTEGGDLDKLGRGFIWHGEIPHCIHQNHVFAVRVNPENLIPEYLSYLVQSDYGRAYFLSAAKQTTNLASVNSTQLKAFPVLLPDFDEQREIVTILSDHDTTIRNLQAEAASLREVKRGLMQKLLSGQVRV